MKARAETAVWIAVGIFLFVCFIGALRMAAKIYQPQRGRPAPIPTSHDVHEEAGPMTTSQEVYERERRKAE